MPGVTPAPDLPQPLLKVPPLPTTWDQPAPPDTWPWLELPDLSPFVLADGTGLATYQTETRVCCDAQYLYVRFDCEDPDIWGTYTQRDQPLYDEEVVEVFIAPGTADPVRYYEFEVSPKGVLFDAAIHNPTSHRDDIVVDLGWDCPDIRWQAGQEDAAEHWWATLAIPWQAIQPPGNSSSASGERPEIWRANFYRIERPRGAAPEFSCWSPTFTQPADFHKPAHFGTLVLPSS